MDRRVCFGNTGTASVQSVGGSSVESSAVAADERRFLVSSAFPPDKRDEIQSLYDSQSEAVQVSALKLVLSRIKVDADLPESGCRVCPSVASAIIAFSSVPSKLPLNYALEKFELSIAGRWKQAILYAMSPDFRSVCASSSFKARERSLILEWSTLPTTYRFLESDHSAISNRLVENNIDIEIVELNERARVLGIEIAFHARATVVLIRFDSKAGLVSAEKIDPVSGRSPLLIFVMVSTKPLSCEVHFIGSYASMPFFESLKLNEDDSFEPYNRTFDDAENLLRIGVGDDEKEESGYTSPPNSKFRVCIIHPTLDVLPSFEITIINKTIAPHVYPGRYLSLVGSDGRRNIQSSLQIPASACSNVYVVPESIYITAQNINMLWHISSRADEFAVVDNVDSTMRDGICSPSRVFSLVHDTGASRKAHDETLSLALDIATLDAFERLIPHAEFWDHVWKQLPLAITSELSQESLRSHYVMNHSSRELYQPMSVEPWATHILIQQSLLNRTSAMLDLYYRTWDREHGDSCDIVRYRIDLTNNSVQAVCWQDLDGEFRGELWKPPTVMKRLPKRAHALVQLLLTGGCTLNSECSFRDTTDQYDSEWSSEEILLWIPRPWSVASQLLYSDVERLAVHELQRMNSRPTVTRQHLPADVLQIIIHFLVSRPLVPVFRLHRFSVDHGVESKPSQAQLHVFKAARKLVGMGRVNTFCNAGDDALPCLAAVERIGLEIESPMPDAYLPQPIYFRDCDTHSYETVMSEMDHDQSDTDTSSNASEPLNHYDYDNNDDDDRDNGDYDDDYDLHENASGSEEEAPDEDDEETTDDDSDNESENSVGAVSLYSDEGPEERAV